jgi:hypothetical protein
MWCLKTQSLDVSDDEEEVEGFLLPTMGSVTGPRTRRGGKVSLGSRRYAQLKSLTIRVCERGLARERLAVVLVDERRVKPSTMMMLVLAVDL